MPIPSITNATLGNMIVQDVKLSLSVVTVTLKVCVHVSSYAYPFHYKCYSWKHDCRGYEGEPKHSYRDTEVIAFVCTSVGPS